MNLLLMCKSMGQLNPWHIGHAGKNTYFKLNLMTHDDIPLLNIKMETRMVTMVWDIFLPRIPLNPFLSFDVHLFTPQFELHDLHYHVF